MSTYVESAKELLFGVNGLRASNIKLYPGTSREVTADEAAAEIIKTIEAVIEGDFEECNVD